MPRGAAGDGFTQERVGETSGWLLESSDGRFSTKLKSLKQRLLAAGMLTSKQISDMLGLSRTTIGKWRTQGRLVGRICNDLGEWLYWPPEQLSRDHTTEAATASLNGTATSTAGGAV